MNELSYTNYTNVSRPFMRGYEPGDTLIAGWSGTLTVDTTWVTDVKALAERLFVIHNRDDRPDGAMCPSMSVGDVCVIGEIALTVEDIGFQVCTIDRADIDTEHTYRQWAALR